MPPLIVELGTLVLEVLGVLGAVCVVAALLGSSEQSQFDVRLVAGGVVGAITLALALGGWPTLAGRSIRFDAPGLPRKPASSRASVSRAGQPYRCVGRS